MTDFGLSVCVVQCACGWQGPVSELRAREDRSLCPICFRVFLPARMVRPHELPAMLDHRLDVRDREVACLREWITRRLWEGVKRAYVRECGWQYLEELDAVRPVYANCLQGLRPLELDAGVPSPFGNDF